MAQGTPQGMLILTRRTGESVDIGGQLATIKGPVKVTVLGVKGNQVRLGFTADRSVPIDREEITERKRLELLPPQQVNGNA